MIAFVRGSVYETGLNSVTIDTGAIGYEVYMTGRDLSRLQPGRDVFVYTWFQVREDAMQLFGFLEKDDLEMFSLLLAVNGVGPKAALGILGGITADELRFAVLADDVKTLSKAPGVGKKTAQKLILELKDRLNLQDAFEHRLAGTAAAAGAGTASPESRSEAVEALTALGYSPTEAARAVQRVQEGNTELTDTESILKLALKYL